MENNIIRPNRRVLHIMSGYGGGISTFIRQLALQAPKLGICFDLVTYDDCPQEFVDIIQRTGGDIYQLQNPKKAGWQAFYNSFKRVIAIYKYDVVHCHIAGYRALAYCPLVRRYSPEASFYIHAHYQVLEDELDFGQKIKHFVDQIINRSLTDSYIGCSRQAVWSLFGNIPYEEMVVFPNCINEEQFLLDDEKYSKLRLQGRTKYNLSEDDLIFGQIGRLEAIKNHDLTLSVAKYIKDNKLPGKFLIAGTGSLESQLKEKVQKLGLVDQVIFLGRVEPIEELYPVLDALIFPSHNEGLGTVAIESQAAGVPVVMSQSLPREVDLGLGTVARLSLEETSESWYKELVRMSELRVPSIQKREIQLKIKKFTGEEAIMLYSQLINGNLPSHHIY